jgi:hypothetical protein
MTATKPISYTSAKEFDFTTLDNYVPPEKTLQEFNRTWMDKKSAFYSRRYGFINSEACVRRAPDEIEIRCEEWPFTDEQLDALRTVVCDVLEPEEAELTLVRDMGITHYFRYNTIVTPRGHFGLAVVRDNKLLFVYSS